MGEQCQKILVPEQVCYLRFVDAAYDRSEELPFATARGEALIADLDADGRIIGIELVGPAGQKPCQR